MDRWVEGNADGVGCLSFVVAVTAVFGVALWFLRNNRLRMRATDVLIGFGLVIPIVLLEAVFLGSPESRVLDFALRMAPSFVAFAIAMAVWQLRNVRAEKRDVAELQAAREAVPESAREFFATAEFQTVAIRAEEGTPPPGVASDVIAFWAFRGLETGDYAEWARSIHYATAIHGWRMSSQTMAAAIPALVAPFLCSGDKQWDPAVDRKFRDTAVELLSMRFGLRVSA